MIPDTLVWLERLPLTPSGKINRSVLPDQPTSTPKEAIAPRTRTERTVAAIWAEHVGVKSVGVEDNFFDLGGHSLLAVKLITALELRFAVSLPLALLFEAPTVSALARAIDDRKSRRGLDARDQHPAPGSKDADLCAARWRRQRNRLRTAGARAGQLTAFLRTRA